MPSQRFLHLRSAALSTLLILGLSSHAGLGSAESGHSNAGGEPTLDTVQLTPGWSFESNQASALAGYWTAAAGDVNGDGYDDILVGALFYDGGQTDEGKVFLFQGSPSGPSATPSWTFECDQAGARCGESVAGAGDVNGDGYDDVIVGAPFYDNGQTDEGRAFLFLGSPTGLSTAFSWSQKGNQAGAYYGIVSSAGDGYDDVLVTAHTYDHPEPDEGRTFLYLGSASGLSTTAAWTAETNQSGAVLVAFGAGDVNGDGFADIILGSRAYDAGQTNEGKVFLYLGSASGPGSAPIWTAEGNQDGGQFGFIPAAAGDVNADGYDDVLVISDLYDDPSPEEGAAFLWLGGPSGKILQGINGTPLNADWKAEGEQSSAFLRWGGGIGDFNSDGFDDVVIGSALFDNTLGDEGRIQIYRGISSGLSTQPSWVAYGGRTGARFGWTAEGAGDVNGDGVPDVLVGAETLSNGQSQEGGAFVILGLPPPCVGSDEDLDGFRTCTGDCNDADPLIHPGVTELCNNVDDDCDGTVDEGFIDADHDGITGCAGDCNDSNPAVHPGATEVCNHVDDDCDVSVDEGFPDADFDGFASCAGDCNDANPAIHPGAVEVCNGVDDDCNNATDESLDLDGDGFSACSGDCNDASASVHPGATEACNQFDDDCDGATDEDFATDVDGDGFTACAGDCNDANPAVHPGAIELCNGVNDDCDAGTDEGFDTDGDGITTCAGDCNDASSTVHPGALEICNQVDDNCDGVIDDGFEPDADGDGFRICNGDCNDGDPAVHPGAQELCNQIDDDCDNQVDDEFTDFDVDGYSICTGDCNDNAYPVHPGASEVCNLTDDDCDGSVDEGFDIDGDGLSSCGGDCNDANPAVHPGASEACNGVDDDCSGLVDDAPDFDGDGIGGCFDCNESNPMVWLPPMEVQNLEVWNPVGTYLSWDDQGWVGPETVYDISTAGVGPGFGINLNNASCLQAGVPAYPYYEDTRSDPTSGTAYWYLARARNSCGISGYGTNYLGQQRTLPACP
jgi:hypothetical protein